MLLATAAIAAGDPSSEPRPVFDPFETAAPIAGVNTGEKPVRVLPQPVDPFEPNATGGQQFGHGLAKLAADEQLPGLSPAAAPAEAPPTTGAAADYRPDDQYPVAGRHVAQELLGRTPAAGPVLRYMRHESRVAV